MYSVVRARDGEGLNLPHRPVPVTPVEVISVPVVRLGWCLAHEHFQRDSVFMVLRFLARLADCSAQFVIVHLAATTAPTASRPVHCHSAAMVTATGSLISCSPYRAAAWRYATTLATCTGARYAPLERCTRQSIAAMVSLLNVRCCVRGMGRC